MLYQNKQIKHEKSLNDRILRFYVLDITFQQTDQKKKSDKRNKKWKKNNFYLKPSVR